MKKIWLDSLLGLGLTLLVAGLAYMQFPVTESLENKLYDLRLQYAPKTPLSDQILFVAVDDTSIASVGRWPWPRSYVGQLIHTIASGGPKVIGVNILYVDKDQNQGLETVRELKEKYFKLVDDESKLLNPLFTRVRKDPRYRGFPVEDPLYSFNQFITLFTDAEESLDNDTQLAEVLEGTPGVVLPLFFSVDKPLAEESDEALEQLKGRALTHVQSSGKPSKTLEGFQPLVPIDDFAKAASGLGHSNLFADIDGSLRRETLFIRYKDHFIPSLALEMSRVALGLPSDQVQVTLGQELILGSRRIPLGQDNKMLINYQGGFSALKTVSAIDILSEKVTPEAFKNKLVLIGLAATGVGSLFVTPLDSTFPSNGIIVSALQNLLDEKGRFLIRPEWSFYAEMGSLVLIGLLVMFLLPRLRATTGAVVAVLLLALIAGSGVYLFMAKGYWIKIFYPMVLLALSYLLMTVRRLVFTERRKELVEAESIETNKMLGLSFQGQGMLDLAFEKFRKCPVDNAMKELLYNLALDFERKRQFAKAAVVYEHIAGADPSYKDIAERRKSAKSAGETMIIGGVLGGGKKEGTVVIEGSAVKPTLGRYEIQKELGRGAMGIVYLGQDPKINRPVAIKTLKFDDDVESETVKQVKERFFREAESAGTLNHPNIIRIYDAGDDNEISYIAMELLDGEDLKKYGEKANLLPVPKVMEYIATIALALDYAHSCGVVHRDIKPANIMRLKDGSLRVTDFGIARITASSRTQTGTVLGTPSYMSPEQIAGKKVDGRSDLFSLGVMFYEMLTGEKPFEGDSIATLLFKIANEPHPDALLKSSERVSPCVKAILDKALQKDPEKRYQRGGEMARDVQECLKNPKVPPSTLVVVSPPSPVSSPDGEDAQANIPPREAPMVVSSSDTRQLKSDLPVEETVRIPTPAPEPPKPVPSMPSAVPPAPRLTLSDPQPPADSASDTVQIPPDKKNGPSPDDTVKL